MPIKSYLAYPQDNQKEDLINAVSQIPSCEVIPSENQDLLIVVTEANNTIEDEQIKEKIEAIESLKLLSLVSGFDTTKRD
ncbi:hypothetical protein [Seonamhaeicola marinus]|uniref:Uncharacterized protein n=1 Tax=Seonamhaeicola marinus TaxID=1912246 RepID=A0A5D0I483_9FLAO|nr:hypothetical protein [Seonamhaeicola marinus]TYA78505.1 hypothetical protein FUA24_09105 [Seonamhaeicola marinus]